jgi:DNA gyrase subunit B
MPPEAKNPPVVDKQGYSEDNIKYLDPREHIRLRPGMYVGGTDSRALHHLIYEVVDNSIDEALAGRCDHITVTLHDDGSATVADNGAGIPVGINRDLGISTLEGVMTKVGMGGKFDSDAYKVSGGLHGVGVSAVNALSAEFIATVHREGYVWQQRYHEGKPVTKVEKIRPLESGEATGTIQRFLPDFNIMDFNEFSYQALVTRFREMAFVTRKVTITLRDERIQPIPRETTFYFDGGLASFVRYLNRNRKPIHDVIHAEREIEIDGKHSKFSVTAEVAFQYTDTATTTEIAFTNTINTPDGGTHLTGLRSAITGAINRYARKQGILKEKDTNFSGNDTMEGLTAIVSVKHPDPQFESQTKVKLLNPEVQGVVSQVVSEAFMEFMELNSREARRVVDKCMTSKRAREAARKARDLVRGGPSLLESSNLPGKLADCSQRGENAEIYIVEGDSAGGCFSGDTLVALADGRNISFEQLVQEQAEGKAHFVYTIRHDGKVGLERAIHARVTKRNAKVIRVTLDDGEVITCTPDHRFMLRGGCYKEAATLTPEDALMPLYRKYSDMAETGITGIIEKQRIVLQQTYYKRYFDGDEVKAREAISNYDHRAVSIEYAEETMDVYDIEVPGTHNFALASGVFVHNSAKQGRDRHFQAILPLRGKILNTERARLDKILDNNEVKALISALGAGIHEDFDVGKLRYGRVIVMTDADVDGSHIRTLLLTFFFRHMQALIANGHLYIAQPPIYLLKQGKRADYVYPRAGYNDAQLLELALKDYDNPGKVGVQRYKGLGEMNPDQLWNTTMNPETRTLLQVTIEDAAEADKIFDMLMGNAVPPRRRFIQTNAKQVKNLDV